MLDLTKMGYLWVKLKCYIGIMDFIDLKAQQLQN